MADQLSGIAIIICIAFGVLTFVLLFIFANRQIKRFSLKSKSSPHAPIAQDAPKSLLTEINRRLDTVKSIACQPTLLKKDDDIYFEDEELGSHMPVHLYRMKAMDSLRNLDSSILAADGSKIRHINQDYRVYLVRLAQCGLLGQIDISIVHKFVDLYEFARHEPGEFTKENYVQFMEFMVQIIDSISSGSNATHHNSKTISTSAYLGESSRHLTNGNVPAVPSCLQVETPIDEKTSTYETSV